MRSFFAPFVSLLIATSVMHYQPPGFMTHDDECRAWIRDSINADQELPILNETVVADYALSKYAWKWQGSVAYMVLANFSAKVVKADPDRPYHEGDRITGKACVLYLPNEKKTVITSVSEFLQNAERIENDVDQKSVFGFPPHWPPGAPDKT